MPTPGEVFLQALSSAAAEGLESNVQRWARFVGWRSGDVLECQVLNADYVKQQNYSFLARDPEEFTRLIREKDHTPPPAFYTVLNGIRPAIAEARGYGEWSRMFHGSSTIDRDIEHRRALYIDFDVIRPPGTSSTDAELLLCCDVAAQVYIDLAQILGGEDALAVGLSGNGCALFIALDWLVETPGLGALVKDILLAVKAIYGSKTIDVDTKVSDAKRVVPAFGTWKRKNQIPDPLRPHRRTGLVVPDTVRRLTQPALVDLLARLRERMPEPVRPSSGSAVSPTEVSAEDPSGSVELTEVRKKLVGLRKMKAAGIHANDKRHYEILTAVLEGTSLAAAGERSTTVNQAVSLLAFQIDSWEVLAEVLRPSIAAMEAEPPEDFDHWMRVAEASYARAAARVEQHNEEKAKRQEDNERIRDIMLTIAPPSSAKGTSLTEMVAQYALLANQPAPPPTPEDDAWMQHFIRSGDGKIQACPFNTHLILANTPTFKGTIRFNLLKKVVEVVGGPFEKESSEGVLPQKIGHWLHKFGKLSMKKHEIEDEILVVAYDNAYDPVVDYLTGIVWDGILRLDTFFLTYARARTKRGTKDLTAYLKKVASMFFVAAVSRQLPPLRPGWGGPGCQVDSMLILEGIKEGEGKTELFRILFGDHYIVMKRDLNEKDAQMVPGQYWGAEFGELSAMSRTDDRVLKGFLTERVDKFRRPYGKQHVECPRRCVFVGTTNEEEWNSPGKGKRRYWPVYVEEVDLEAVKRDRDQLWAEAVHRYRQGERWWFTKEEREEADAEAEARMADSYIQVKISSWWSERPPAKRPEFVTIVDLVEAALKMGAADRVTPAIMSSISQAMTRLGFKKERQGPATVWVPSEELKGRAVRPSYLRVVTEPAEGIQAIAEAKADPTGGE